MIPLDTLFSVIKWVGVVYLIYLGLMAIFSRSGPLTINPSNQSVGKARHVFLRGFILEISNPKALLYFSALLPQFIDISNPIIPQLAILCAITLLLDLVCYSLYGYLGFASIHVGIKLINRSAGAMLIFADVKMASVER